VDEPPGGSKSVSKQSSCATTSSERMETSQRLDNKRRLTFHFVLLPIALLQSAFHGSFCVMVAALCSIRFACGDFRYDAVISVPCSSTAKPWASKASRGNDASVHGAICANCLHRRDTACQLRTTSTDVAISLDPRVSTACRQAYPPFQSKFPFFANTDAAEVRNGVAMSP
jgi:hypothetical protein